MFTLLDGKDAMKKLSTIDPYLQEMTLFDFESRLRKKFLSKESGLQLYRELIQLQVKKWTISLKKRFNQSLEKLNMTLISSLPLPKTIFVIVSKSNLERDAAYCRLKNVIVLPDRMVGNHTILAHELFHILSRNNIKLRDKIYKVFGFIRLERDVKIPSNLIKITNPDALFNEHYVEIEKVKVVPIIFSTITYDVRDVNFFKYVRFGLIDVVNNNSRNWSLIQSYMNKFKNIKSLLNRSHPEEISATYFSIMMVDGSTTNLLTKDQLLKIKKLLNVEY